MLESTLKPLLQEEREAKVAAAAAVSSSRSSPPSERVAPKRTMSSQSVDGVDNKEPPSRLNLPGYSLVGGSLTQDEDDLGRVSKFFVRGSLVALLLWLVLSIAALTFSSKDAFEEPAGIEKSAHILVFMLLVVTNGSRLIPIILRENGVSFIRSGVLIGTLSVQLMAIASNFWLGFFPSPVYVDSVSGMRVHLLRWTEWVPVGFLMCFLMDNIDLPTVSKSASPKYTLAVTIGLCTMAGGIFPFCPDLASWLTVFFISWLMYCALFVKWWNVAKRHFAIKGIQEASKDQTITADRQEAEGLVAASFTLTTSCVVTWTLFVLTYSIICLGATLAPEDSILSSSSLEAVVAAGFEVASKIWYFCVLIDTYESIFDMTVRAARRLEELRNFMSVVWESSSDVIIFCGKRDDRITARLSPAFVELVGLSDAVLPFLTKGDISLVLEVFPANETFFVFALDLSKPITREDAARFQHDLRYEKRQLVSTKKSSIEEKNLARMAQLAVKAVSSGFRGLDDSLMVELLHRGDSGGGDITLRCEGKVARLDSDSSVVVLRDISDRLQRFEAEKKLVKELTSRKKDAEANRFTRHEIKNGVLAAIAIVDHLRDRRKEESNDNSKAAADSEEGFLDELDVTLKDILDTILDEAMAREIIYGEYQPRTTRLDVASMLLSIRRSSSDRFPITVVPDPFPQIAMDRQLLRYIYRNAVANAVKFGKEGGVVTTSVEYSLEKGRFRMEVINLPGPAHSELLRMSNKDVAAIFDPGTQLSVSRLSKRLGVEVVRSASTGNGAWIMQKCAESLGGLCDIKFEPTRTVFSFECSANAFLDPISSGAEKFRLPDKTWGVVIDDSVIQRKLMNRFLKMAGIAPDRVVIVGKNSEEIYGFCDMVKELMSSNPDDMFLVIADENLDIVDGGAHHETVSGSRCVEKLRKELDETSKDRLLTLIRSANDSTIDIEMYMSRADGFLIKEPLRREGVLESIRPWWQKKFPSSSPMGESSFVLYPSSDDDSSYGTGSEDVRSSLDVIGALCTARDKAGLETRWMAIRDKLHILKGDLMTIVLKDDSSKIVQKIDELLKHSSLPDNFTEKWLAMRQEIEAML